jgi:3-oxoacyl-(acyl-carrier-protein) synthase
MKRSRVVITGLGCVTPMGPDVARTWEGLIQGRSAVDFIKRFDASGFPTKFAAEIQETPDIESCRDATRTGRIRRARSRRPRRPRPWRTPV